MPRLGASPLKLPLEIGQGHIHIVHGRARASVAKQFHHRRKAHASAEHFRSVGMPELVGDDICGKADRVADQMQVIAEPGEKRYSRPWPGQEPSVGRQRILECFCTLSNPFSNCVTSGVSPAWRPSRPMTRQRKLPLGHGRESYTASKSSEGRLVTRMMMSASDGRYTMISFPHSRIAFCTAPIAA